jgi:hypothetical protein
MLKYNFINVITLITSFITNIKYLFISGRNTIMEKSEPGGRQIVFIHDQGGPKNPQFSISLCKMRINGCYMSCRVISNLSSA